MLNLAGARITSKSQFDKLVQLAAEGMNINLSGADLEFDDEDEGEDDESVEV